jgi:hypothetical protein
MRLYFPHEHSNPASDQNAFAEKATLLRFECAAIDRLWVLDPFAPRRIVSLETPIAT